MGTFFLSNLHLSKKEWFMMSTSNVHRCVVMLSDMNSSNVFLRGIGMSILLVMILLRKNISKMSKLCIINRLNLILLLACLRKHLSIVHTSTWVISSTILATILKFFIFFYCVSFFRNHHRVHHCKLGDTWFPLTSWSTEVSLLDLSL